MYNGELSGLGTDITRAEKGVPADNSKPLSRMMSLFIFLGFVSLFLHHLPHTLSSFAIGDVDKVDASGQVADVQCETFPIAFDCGQTLA